ncbi:MAG: hypothetical protein ACRDL0_14405 [Thermoleophilaceae bacterium]
MKRAKWIPPVGGFAVAIALTIPAGLGDWSAIAVYGIMFAGVFTWAALFAFTEGKGSSSRQ